MPKLKAQHWTIDAGITKEGAPTADAALHHFMRGMALIGNDPGMAGRVLDEAIFRSLSLPRLSKVYQLAYMRAQEKLP